MNWRVVAVLNTILAVVVIPCSLFLSAGLLIFGQIGLWVGVLVVFLLIFIGGVVAGWEVVRGTSSRTWKFLAILPWTLIAVVLIWEILFVYLPQFLHPNEITPVTVGTS